MKVETKEEVRTEEPLTEETKAQYEAAKAKVETDVKELHSELKAICEARGIKGVFIGCTQAEKIQGLDFTSGFSFGLGTKPNLAESNALLDSKKSAESHFTAVLMGAMMEIADMEAEKEKSGEAA